MHRRRVCRKCGSRTARRAQSHIGAPCNDAVANRPSWYDAPCTEFYEGVIVLTIAERQEAIQLLRVATDEIAAEVVHLSAEQLITPYLANEWTVAQNVHHLPDAHSYAINNLRLVLSEDKPTWKPYSPDGFAQIADAREADISVSLDLMRAMHIRWVRMLESLSEADFARTGISVSYGERSIDDLLRIYSRHARSHVEQIRQTLAAAK